jgi:class 3 adenylate cyclase
MADLTDVPRRLVAVFAADVEGYSRLMSADEVGTLKTLTETIDPHNELGSDGAFGMP